VQTENFTAVLDSCYSGGSTRKIRVRARDNKDKDVQISPLEKSYQEQWLSRLKLSREDFVEEGTVFAIINGKGKVTLRSREGLVGEATVEGVAQAGMLLRKA
jgi:hypothetical protein